VSQRWLVAAALFAVVFSASNQIAAFGVFLPALADQFGWSRGAISVALSISLLLGGLAGFGVGAIADRHGPRGILLLTVALAGGGYALASTTGALWHLYVFVGVMGGLGTSGFYVIASTTVTRWFDRDRGLALALVLVGFNVSFVTAGPAAAWLIERVGWRGAYLVFGGWLCVVGSLAALVVRDPPRHRVAPPGHAAVRDDHGVSVGEAMGDRRLWLLLLSWFLLGGVLLMMTVHVVPYARDRGVDLASAALALTAYGVGAAVGRLASGPLSDRLGPQPIMRASFTLQVIALVVLAFGPSQAVLLPMVAVFGLGFTGADTVYIRVIPDVFGLKALGAITGVLTMGWRAGAALGPALAGFIHDATGSYALPFGLAPVAVIVAYALFAAGSKKS
jgi:MFS family permease